MLYTNKFGNSKKTSPNQEAIAALRFSENSITPGKWASKSAVKGSKDNFSALEDLRVSLYEKA
tara:strand:- start:472 stop:660 length:189 start_codon:yes stop_codon:yes gene_type:complete